MMPLNPSQPTHLGRPAGGSRWAHGPACAGSGTGSLGGTRPARAGSMLHVTPLSGTTAIDRNG